MGQPESAAAHWLPASPARLALRARRRWRGRCAPGRPSARGSRVTASRYALGAEGGGAVRPGAYMCSPRKCARCLLASWGGVGMSKTSCAAALRAAREAWCKVCFELLPRARVGWHTARTLLPPPRSSGAPVRWLLVRGWRASGVAAAPRSRAAGAPATRRRRAVGGACACRARSNGRRRPCGGWWWQQLRITSGRLPLIGGSIILEKYTVATRIPRGANKYRACPTTGRWAGGELSRCGDGR